MGRRRSHRTVQTDEKEWFTVLDIGKTAVIQKDNLALSFVYGFAFGIAVSSGKTVGCRDYGGCLYAGYGIAGSYFRI